MKLGPLAGLSDSYSQSQKNQTKNQLSHNADGPLQWPIEADWSIPELPGSPTNEWFDGETKNAVRKPELSFFLPVHYQSGHSYPLVVWLHSGGSSHRQLDHVMPLISDRNFVGVSLSGTERLASQRFGWLQNSDAIELTVNQVTHILALALGRFNINRERVFIAGQGAGGTMAYRVAFEHPELFAGVASLNGSLPCTLNPLSNWRICRQLPVFWSHGRRSTEFPETNLCHQLRLLHVAGFDVTLRQYPCDDQLPGQALGDLNVWMMDQISKMGANIIG